MQPSCVVQGHGFVPNSPKSVERNSLITRGLGDEEGDDRISDGVRPNTDTLLRLASIIMEY
jgi:hypothetical protein